MIVAGARGFVKNQYRKFNIKSADLTPGDDYAMMREVLTRRFKRLVLDEAEAPAAGVRPCRSRRSQREQHSDPDGSSCMVSDREGSDDPSRIEAPQPPPIDRRGGSALAFGVLRADADEPLAAPRPSWRRSRRMPRSRTPASEEFPDRGPTWC